MAENAEARLVITMGGKGSSLSSSSVYAISTGNAQVRLDSSAIERLTLPSSSPLSANRNPASLSIPKTLSQLELQASLSVLLNKLLSCSISSAVPIRIVETLNSQTMVTEFDLGARELTEKECAVLEKIEVSSFVVPGICAILDHEASSFAVVIDAVAALSCEALKAEVGEALNVTDSGDGTVSKEEVGVASDMKVLLNGSKLVGKHDCGKAVSKIPKIHGSLREIVKSLHAKTRVELNSPGVKDGVEESIEGAVLWLESAIRNVGKSSLSRAKMNLKEIGSVELKECLLGIFEKDFPSHDCLTEVDKNVPEKLVHDVNVLLGVVWKIIAWEAITAFIALEGVEWYEKEQGAEVNVRNVKPDKKSEKKKKVTLGKGTSVIVQLIKDALQSTGRDRVDGTGLLEKWVQDLFSLLNPKHTEFDSLLKKVKEVVESNESRRLPKLPKGTRDFANEQMTIRKQAFSIIEGVFERHGASALDTPAFEMRETLMGKYGEDSKLIYDLADQGGELCALRYDLTVPFARYMAMNGLTSFKRYQIAKVYRRDNPSKGRYREFYQCDFDIAGQHEKMAPDFEVVKILTELLDDLRIGDYEVKLNHRKLLDGMMEICGVPPEKFRTICSSIDKLDKQPFEQIRKEMVEEKGLTGVTADKIGSYVKQRGSPLELLSILKQEGSNFLENSASLQALNDLEILFNALETSQCSRKVVFDMSLARGLDYYTGVIFEAVFKGKTQVGSIAAGGRYDNLIGMFGTKQVPAVGVSLGIERVFTIMEEQLKDNNKKPRATKTEVLVSILGDDLSRGAELVSELWNAKIKAEFLVSKRMMKHNDRARDSKIPWMVIEGEQERQEGVLLLKNYETREEVRVRRSELLEELNTRLSP